MPKNHWFLLIAGRWLQNSCSWCALSIWFSPLECKRSMWLLWDITLWPGYIIWKKGFCRCFTVPISWLQFVKKCSILYGTDLSESVKEVERFEWEDSFLLALLLRGQKTDDNKWPAEVQSLVNSQKVGPQSYKHKGWMWPAISEPVKVSIIWNHSPGRHV